MGRWKEIVEFIPLDENEALEALRDLHDRLEAAFPNVSPASKFDCSRDINAIRAAIKALERVDVLDNIKAIVSGWKTDTWTDNASYECMVKIAEIVEGAVRNEANKC